MGEEEGECAELGCEDGLEFGGGHDGWMVDGTRDMYRPFFFDLTPLNQPTTMKPDDDVGWLQMMQ
jgi:hypothetical protein